jgi:hypothetical protein
VFAPWQADRLGRHLLAVLDPDGLDRFDPQAIDRRELSVVTDATGMVLIRGQLDPGTGAPLLAVLDHLAKPTPPLERRAGDPGPAHRGSGTPTPSAWPRKLALAAVGSGAEIDRPRVVIHAPLLRPGGRVGADRPDLRTLARPTPVRRRPASRPDRPQRRDLNLGRAQRTVTTHQRRALIARDGGCVIPDCHAPGAWCDGHHVRWWSKGGRTDLTNLALLCPRHHTDVHAGIWSLEMRDGIPWARPPTWVDPATTMATQHLPPPPQPSPPTPPRPRPTTADDAA